ncbi:CoA pyrophosphatase [Archaeoglobales archaeon]|nr:MAG: CoA pyrophosphatase [Archaeoglobales archaeon]
MMDFVLKNKLKNILDDKTKYNKSKVNAAILFPIMLGKEPKLVMIMRSKNLSRSAGHIAFPGGIKEANEEPEETALREAEEEIGIDGDTVDIIGYLTPKEVIEHKIKIHPVVGVFEEQELIPDSNEVSKLLVDDLKKVLLSRRVTDWGPNFECDGELVWGATSRILDDFYLRIIRNFNSIDEFFEEL